jgi:hypothetical protein
MTMNASLKKNIEAWEGEGGAASSPLGIAVIPMNDSASQVELAPGIKSQVKPSSSVWRLIPRRRQPGDLRAITPSGG